VNRVLISTSSLWNCGDEFIRNGVMNLLNLKPDVSTIWWNRAKGVRSAFANNLKLNIQHCDYFVVAGTPVWIERIEYIYRYCLKNSIPIALIGVGSRGGIWNFRQKDLLRKLSRSGLVEVCMVRDTDALAVLKKYGFDDATLILDPAFFVRPLTSHGNVSVLGWRDYKVPEKVRLKDYAKRTVERITGNHKEIVSFTEWYDRFMQDIFHRLPDPKLIVVHDNREIQRAEELFGKEHVFYSTDYREIFRAYSDAARYIGSRIHGAVPSFIQGACVNLLYLTDKAHVIENSGEILSKHLTRIEDSMKVIYTKGQDVSFPKDFVDKVPDHNAVCCAVEKEKMYIREKFKQTAVLSGYLQ